MKTIPVAQARSRLTEILDLAENEPVLITKGGHAAAVAIHPEEYEWLTGMAAVARQLLREAEASEEWVPDDQVDAWLHDHLPRRETTSSG